MDHRPSGGEARTPPWRGAVRLEPPYVKLPHTHNGLYGRVLLYDIPTPPLPTPRTPLFRRGSRKEVGRLNPYHGEEFSVAFHGPPPGGGASRRWEDFRLCVTAHAPGWGDVAP